MKLLVAFLLLISMVSCGQDRAVIVLEVDQIPRGMVRIEATLEFNGRIFTTETIAPYLKVAPGTAQFSYSYPRNETGKTKILLKAIADSGCVVGTAMYEVDISRIEAIKGMTSFPGYQLADGINKNLLGIWGSSKNNVWVVGEAGTLLHWDGMCWLDWTDAVHAPSGLTAIDGVTESDVWVAGNDSTIGRFDGQKWDFKPRISGVLSKGNALSIRTFSRSDAWITGISGTSFILYSWDGTTWIDRKNPTNTLDIDTSSKLPNSNDNLYSIVGTRSADMMLAGFSRQKSGSTAEQSGLIQKCLTSQVDCDQTKNSQDTPFFSVALPTGADLTADYTAGWTSGVNDYWFGVGTGTVPTENTNATILHWEKGKTSSEKVSTDPGVIEAVDYIWGKGADMWINAYDRSAGPLKSNIYVKRAAATTYSKQQDALLDGKVINAIWGSAVDDVWLVGTGGLLVRWDGSKYKSYP